MLLFWTPDLSRPVGGIKQIYRNVQILDEAGMAARVLHTQTGFSCKWFTHQAPLAYVGESLSRRARWRLGSVVSKLTPEPELDLSTGRTIKLAKSDGSYESHTLSEEDVLVVPEYLGASLPKAGIDLPLVVFNQNAHGTFRGCGLGDDSRPTIYQSPNVLGAVVVSEHSKQYLRYAFTELNVYRVVNGVDSTLFHPNETPRVRRIAFMPRKLKSDLEQIINLLKARGKLRGWKLAPIEGLDEVGVARVLRRSLLFLSTCREEGFGLPPVEAGMSGCVVVGYTGFAADEYFESGLAEKVLQGDVLGFARAVERTLERIELDEASAVRQGRELSDFLNRRYSLARERQSVIRAWEELLNKRDHFPSTPHHVNARRTNL